MVHRHRLRFALDSFCLGMILLHGVVLWRAYGQIVEALPDLRIFYTAGLMLRRGQGPTLYNDDLQLKTQREFVALRPTDHSPLPYNHPPFEAILFLPFTYLPFLRGYALWFLVNGLLLAISIHVVRPYIPAIVKELPELLFLAPLAFFPVFYAFLQGQDSVLLLLLYCLAYAAFRRGRDLQAGIWLGLGLFKFHLVLPFAFILLLRRRWRALGGILLSACGEIAVSCALVGWRELLYYPRYAWHVNQLQAKAVIVPANMPNLRGLLTGWNQSPTMRLPLDLLLLGLSLCLLVWVARRWTPSDLLHADAWDTGFSLAVIATFLVGYHGYNQDFSIALLPILLTFNRLLHSERSRVGTALRIILGLLFLSPLYLVLTLVLRKQSFFALVILAVLFCLARFRPTQDCTPAAQATASA